MPKNLESKNIEQLLAEADELIQQINSNAIKDMEEEHRIQFEKHGECIRHFGADEDIGKEIKRIDNWGVKKDFAKELYRSV
jgi:acyl-CoA hydrolase